MELTRKMLVAMVVSGRRFAHAREGEKVLGFLYLNQKWVPEPIESPAESLNMCIAFVLIASASPT